jgi:hypothetical protein
MSVIANIGPTFSVVPGAALPIGAAVKIVSGKVVAAVAADLNWIGHMENPSYGDASPALVSVRLRNPPVAMIASEAMATIGVEVFGAAAGKIALTGTVKRGVLLEAASGDNSVVLVMPY